MTDAFMYKNVEKYNKMSYFLKNLQYYFVLFLSYEAKTYILLNL